MIFAAIAAAATAYSAAQSSSAAYAAGKARSRAQMRNAEFLREQADFARQLGARRQLQFEDQATRMRSQQAGMFAKAGVDLKGSVLQKLGETSARMEQELEQIEWTTSNEVKFALTKASNYAQASADSVKAGAANAEAALWDGLGRLAQIGAATNWGSFSSGNLFSSFGTTQSSVNPNVFGTSLQGYQGTSSYNLLGG